MKYFRHWIVPLLLVVFFSASPTMMRPAERPLALSAPTPGGLNPEFDTRGIAIGGANNPATRANVGTRNWSQFRGPQSQPVTGRFDLPIQWSEEKGVFWKSELPGRGVSSPIIHGGHAYVTAATGYGESSKDRGRAADLVHHLICLVRETGKYVWQRDVQGTPLTQPLNQQLMKHGFASSTPVSDGEMVYAFFGASGVFAFDVDGKYVWEADVGLGQHPFGSSASPILHKNLLIVNASIESESVVALDKKTGKGVWRIDDVNLSWSTPIVSQSPDGTDELVIVEDGWVRGFDPMTGVERWRCAGPKGNIVSTPFIQHGVCFCNGGTQRRLMAIQLGGQGDVTSSHLLWDVAARATVSSPVYLTGNVYLMSDNGFFQCFDARTGEQLNRLRTPSRSRMYASPLFAGNYFYLPLEDAGVVVCEANPEASLVSHNRIENVPISLKASFCVSANGLFMRNDRYLYCLAGNQVLNQRRFLKDFQNKFEPIVPRRRFEFDQTKNRVRPYSRFLTSERKVAYETILEPFRSDLSWQEAYGLHQFVEGYFDDFESLRARQKNAYWEFLKSEGSEASRTELEVTLSAIEDDVNRHVAFIQDEIKDKKGHVRKAVEKSESITTD